MTREQFNDIKFSARDEFYYKGTWKLANAIDFEEGLINLETEHEDQDHWVRCESITDYKPGVYHF